MAQGRKKQAPPDQLFGFYIPGMQMALNLLEARYNEEHGFLSRKIEELQRIAQGGAVSSGRRLTGPEGEKKTHRISAEGRARIAAAQRRRWAVARKGAGKAAKPVKGGRKKPRFASQDEIIRYAVEHGGTFTKDSFHADHPGLSLLKIGPMVRTGKMKTKGNGVYQVSAEAAAANA